MSNIEFDKKQILVLPAFGKTPELKFNMEPIREAESRLIEAKTVNPVTFPDLEYTFNESYRELKKHLTQVQFAIAQAEKALEDAKADVLLDKYPQYLEEKAIKKTQDNADLRKAFLMRDANYTAALDRIDQLKALESNFEGKIKVMEKVCSFMRVQMNLIIKSGINPNMYNTIKK
jgi:hypothetical protein